MGIFYTNCLQQCASYTQALTAELFTILPALCIFKLLCRKFSMKGVLETDFPDICMMILEVRCFPKSQVGV